MGVYRGFGKSHYVGFNDARVVAVADYNGFLVDFILGPGQSQKNSYTIHIDDFVDRHYSGFALGLFLCKYQIGQRYNCTYLFINNCINCCIDRAADHKKEI